MSDSPGRCSLDSLVFSSFPVTLLCYTTQVAVSGAEKHADSYATLVPSLPHYLGLPGTDPAQHIKLLLIILTPRTPSSSVPYLTRLLQPVLGSSINLRIPSQLFFSVSLQVIPD